MRNIASHTKRAQVAAIAVAAAHECVDQFVASGAANITDGKRQLVFLPTALRLNKFLLYQLPQVVSVSFSRY